MNIIDRFRTASKYFLGNSIPLAGVWGASVPGQWSKRDLIRQYSRVTYAVISAIAEEAAKIEFQVVDKNGKPQINHPFIKLIQNPNPDTSQFQFLELHFTYMGIFGEAYWYIAKGENSQKPKELYHLRPDVMEPVLDKDDPRGLIKEYKMSTGDGKDETYEKTEVFMFKKPNPWEPHRGLGTIQAAKRYIETEDAASLWTRNALLNSGRPSGILNFKGNISDEQFQSVKRQFREKYTGTQNAGKTMLLKGSDGLDYQKLGMELGEVAMKDMKDMTRDDIMLMFRVSKTMLGISDDVNRANAQENHAVFVQNIVKPELDRFIDTVNSFVMPNFGGRDGLMLTYVDPELASDAEKLEEWNLGVNKWITINEVRKQRHLDPLKGGDVLYQPLNMVPITSAPTSEKSQKKDVKKKDSSENKQPQERVNRFKKVFFDHQIAWEKKYRTFMQGEYNTQEKEILSQTRKDVDADWLFDVDASKTRIMAGLSPILLEQMREVARFALDMADDADTQFEITQGMLQAVHDRVEALAFSTNDVSVRLIEETIAQGILEGESVTQLRNRIRDIYNATPERAERIARTESIYASNQGALEAYRQSPVVTAKEWSAEFDACEFCAALDGKVIGLEQEYASLGDGFQGVSGGVLNIDYGDVNMPPLHPNCRCSLLPVVIKGKEVE